MLFKLNTPKPLWHDIVLTPNRGVLCPNDSIEILIEISSAACSRLTHRQTNAYTRQYEHKIQLQVIEGTPSTLDKLKSTEDFLGVHQSIWRATPSTNVQSLLIPVLIKATQLSRLTPSKEPLQLVIESHQLHFDFTLDENTLQFSNFGNTCIVNIANPHPSAAMAVKFKTVCPSRYSISPAFVVLPPHACQPITISLTRSTRDRLYIYEKSHLRLRDCLRIESCVLPTYMEHAAKDKARSPSELARILDTRWASIPSTAARARARMVGKVAIEDVLKHSVASVPVSETMGLGQSREVHPTSAFSPEAFCIKPQPAQEHLAFNPSARIAVSLVPGSASMAVLNVTNPSNHLVAFHITASREAYAVRPAYACLPPGRTISIAITVSAKEGMKLMGAEHKNDGLTIDMASFRNVPTYFHTRLQSAFIEEIWKEVPETYVDTKVLGLTSSAYTQCSHEL
ncbi:hypothetical protein THRCLA_04827 [Thraustotheca clavata]|uniref:MSP domain-containing protein n=1 Tax=Thraustotheca clavata TaxID=74557 RepID=A0A1V9ZXT5_9STRA|nr:hypothetical protein THRCLA_04827 [Thraustotheca clavata]